MTLQDIRKRNKGDETFRQSILGRNQRFRYSGEWAILDRHELLEIIDEGRELVEQGIIFSGHCVYCWAYKDDSHAESCRTGEWLKRCQNE